MLNGVLVRYLMTIVDVMQENYGIDAETLCFEAGVSLLDGTDVAVRISPEDADQLWLAASKLSDEFLGLNVGAAIRYTSYASLGHLLVTCETVGDALQVITENAHYVGAGYFRAFDQETELHLEYQLDAKRPIIEQRAVASLLPFSTLARNIAAGVIPRQIWLQMQKPAGHSRYEEYFKVPVLFGMPSNKAVWNKEELGQRMPDANAALNELLLEHVKKEIIKQHTVTAKITTVIQGIIDAGTCSALNLEYCAALLDTPRRSLQRLLALEGHSFRDVLSAVRRDKAEYMLKNTSYTVAEISEKLGYSEAPAFVRAFRVWKKTSPSKYRLDC